MPSRETNTTVNVGCGVLRARLIEMKDVTPPGHGLSCFWHGIGMGHDQKVYVGISTGAHLRGEPGDVLIFQYDPESGERRFLAGVRQILSDEGNLGPNLHWPEDESVAKVHSDILEHNGRLYFSTHDWHLVDSVEDHRGGHFLSFDPATGRFHDLSKSAPQGVSVSGEGIIAMNILRGSQELVGWTFPYGNVVIHDLATQVSTLHAGGLNRDRVGNVARVVLSTERGQIFAAYARDPAVDGSDRLYRLSRAAGRLEPTDQRFASTGRFEGLAEASDGRTMYLADWNGDLYAFDVERERLDSLGSTLPPEQVAAGNAVDELFNLALSPDDRKLFTLPSSMRRGEGAYHLYEYDLATGTKTDLEDCSDVLEGSTPTGNGVFDDRGRYYLSYYWEGGDRSGILELDVSDRLLSQAPAPTMTPYGGSFSDSIEVTLAPRAHASKIRYTLDGSDPSELSSEYTTPIALRQSGVVKARAFAVGLEKSRLVRATFRLSHR